MRLLYRATARAEMLRFAQHDTALLCMLSNNAAMLSTISVILSNAKDLARWTEMLRFAQHDNAFP
jgi:hypothetical protein